MVRINRLFNDDIGFKGDVEDLQFNPIRHYDPMVSRWTHEDLVGFWVDGANFTRYLSPRQSATEKTVAREKG